MGINVREHRLVPQHEVLGEDETTKVLDQYGITLAELPEISIDDPALEGLKAKEGDVIKITRDSYTAGKTVFYRKVIAHG